MQKELKIICQQEVLGKDFKVYGDFENPLFLAKDVAEWIEHSNPRMMLKSVDDGEKICVNNPYALKGQQEQWFLTEDGLYEVLMQSRKPIAKAFKKEVKKILKSVRKYGGYVNDDILDDLLKNPEAAARFFNELKKERDKREALEEFVEAIAPKARYCDVILKCKNAIAVSVIAKDYGMTATEFNRLLNKHEIQYKVNGVWVLYHKYDKKGYTVSKTFYISGTISTIHTYWTQLGRALIYTTLREHGILPECERKQPKC